MEFSIQRCYGTRRKQKLNALLARRIIVVLPAELLLIQIKNFYTTTAWNSFVDKGMCADTVIHRRGESTCTYLLTTRPLRIDAYGGTGATTRSKMASKTRRRNEKL